MGKMFFVHRQINFVTDLQRRNQNKCRVKNVNDLIETYLWTFSSLIENYILNMTRAVWKKNQREREIDNKLKMESVVLSPHHQTKP